MLQSGHQRRIDRVLLIEVEKGGLEVIVEAAKARGVHLLQLTDNQGKVLIAASLQPFKVLC